MLFVRLICHTQISKVKIGQKKAENTEEAGNAASETSPPAS